DSAPPRAVARWLARRLPALLRRYGVEAAYLFGSWARGEADRLSDIDLIVVASLPPALRRSLPRLPRAAEGARGNRAAHLYPRRVRARAADEPLRSSRAARGKARRMRLGRPSRSEGAAQGARAPAGSGRV